VLVTCYPGPEFKSHKIHFYIFFPSNIQKILMKWKNGICTFMKQFLKWENKGSTYAVKIDWDEIVRHMQFTFHNKNQVLFQVLSLQKSYTSVTS